MKTIFVQATSATKSQGPFTITDPLGYPYKMNLSLSQLSSGVYIEVIDSVSALNIINNTFIMGIIIFFIHIVFSSYSIIKMIYSYIFIKFNCFY